MKDDSGNALIEFALIAPVMILLLLGLIEVGRYASLSIMVANAARAGAQYGSQSLIDADDAAGMQSAALNDGQNLAGLTAAASNFCTCADGSASTCLVTDCASSHRLTYVKVTATGKFNSLFNYPLLPSTLDVSDTAVLQVGY